MLWVQTTRKITRIMKTRTALNPVTLHSLKKKKSNGPKKPNHSSEDLGHPVHYEQWPLQSVPGQPWTWLSHVVEGGLGPKVLAW